ncbi:MAG: DUF2232 domain-containing protein [Actinomycetota bacterium]|nr:DUF2232 domain-containing protein [Actinomycetota bacterium]
MSFDNLNKPAVKRPNLFLLALLTFLATGVSLMVPLAGVVGGALIPVPATILVVTGRKRDAAICAGLGLLPVLFLNYAMFAALAVFLLGTAFLYYWLEQKKLIPLKSVLLIFSVLAVSLLLYLGLLMAINGSGVWAQYLANYRDYVSNLANDPAIGSYGRLITADGQFELVISQTQRLLLFIPKIAAGIILAATFFTAIVNYAISGAVLSKYGTNLKRLPPFVSWDLPWNMVWGLIAGILFLLIPSFTSLNSDWLYILGTNLLIVFGFVYLVLGISVLWGIFEKYRVRMLWRVIVLVLLVFSGFLFLLLLLGLTDVWVNIRKLKR